MRTLTWMKPSQHLVCRGETAGARMLGVTMLAAAVLVLATGAVQAEDHYWSALYGGSFNHWLNWVPQYVPGPDDWAILDLGMNPAYEVTFYEGVINEV